ncbi:hypothetical protein [Aggregatilinea lenta]|uniref:hypothetical protein n=1 Tax=Aggregatilinea lenta TaxID=913108 RepID=UPI000E5B3B06|nr:hypothetical protein [Aggregatilinea lenta]
MDDRRGKLDGAFFSYRATKDGKVLIAWHGKPVVTLKGARAQKFLRQIEGAAPHDAQLVMARATGNFKRGNERPQPGTDRR